MATIRPNDLNASTTPTLSSKSLPAPPLILKPEKSKITAPRVDIEPLYSTIKTSISDSDWSVYKSTISQFLLGNLNQEELTQKLDRILTTPALEHAHNQFICGILANCFRDAPEPGTASWADDKLVGGKSAVGAKGSGNQEGEVEKRLKYEVMQLARRERKRLKTVDGGAGGYDPWSESMREMVEAKKIRVPDTGPASAGGFQKTNWDIEIRKRYTLPLFTETHEFPDTSSIAARMLPICYENGLPSGHSNESPPYLNLATETYIKEALTNFFQRVSSNGPGYIRTADYRRKVEKEEAKAARGELGRSAGGLLPAELEEQRRRRPLCMEDLKLALELGDSYLGQVPIISGLISQGQFLDTPGLEELASPQKGLVNGVVNGTGARHVDGGANGYHVDLGDPMALDDDWTWFGGGVQDVDGLDSVLDGCLAVGI